MPRKARMDAPGALHHIMIRGIEKKSIFKDKFDRNAFLERIGDVLSETSLKDENIEKKLLISKLVRFAHNWNSGMLE